MMTGMTAKFAYGWQLRRGPGAMPVMLLLIGLTLAGCGAGGGPAGPPVYPVTGVVKLNGQPVVGADIVFAKKDGEGSSFGRTNASGEYQLTTRKSNDGAPAGDYLVSITKADDPPPLDSATIPQDSPNYNPFVGKSRHLPDPRPRRASLRYTATQKLPV